MNWTELLKQEIETTYGSTFGLIDLVDGDKLGWKPETGENWMTTGQLLQHLPEACGMCFRGFVTGEWPVPEGVPEDAKPEPTMTPAEAMRMATSVADVRTELERDKQLALAMVAEAGEDRLQDEDTVAPWNETDTMNLGRRLLQMVEHLNTHKCQLFYYLKLQGKPVNTWNLYG